MGFMSCDVVYMLFLMVSIVFPMGPPAISYTFSGMSYGVTNYFMCFLWYCLRLISQEYGFYVISCFSYLFLINIT